MATRIALCVKAGGTEGNAQLATLVEKARKANVGKKIIENAIKRGTGELTADGVQTSDVLYEFMGPGGVAFIVEATTDNKTRTIGLVKHAMSKFGASLSPCQYMFERKGEVVFEAPGQTEDELMDVAIDVGAEDVEVYLDPDNEYPGETVHVMVTGLGELQATSNALAERGYKLRDARVVFKAGGDAKVDFPDEHEKAMLKCLELLDDISEVTNYYTNIG